MQDKNKEIIDNCKVEYMRDTDKCDSCPLKEACPKLKEIRRRYNDAWYEAVMEYGD